MKLVGFVQDHTDDRVVAIVCGAYIEDFIGEVIAHELPGLNAELKNKLLGTDRPLGPVAARLDMARALQIINGEDHRLLTQIIRIRNRFAHNLWVASFDDQPVCEMIDNGLNMGPENEREYRDSFIGDDPAITQTRRQRFFCTALMYCTRLHNMMNVVTHQNRAKASGSKGRK